MFSRTTGTQTTVGWRRQKPFRPLIWSLLRASTPRGRNSPTSVMLRSISASIRRVRAQWYAERPDDPDWRRFWERGEAHYFGVVRPPASFDIQLDDQDLRNAGDV